MLRYQYVVAFGSFAGGAIYSLSELWHRTFLPHKKLTCSYLMIMAVGFWLWGEMEWPWLFFAGFLAGLLYGKIRQYLETEQSTEKEVSRARREAGE